MVRAWEQWEKEGDCLFRVQSHTSPHGGLLPPGFQPWHRSPEAVRPPRPPAPRTPSEGPPSREPLGSEAEPRRGSWGWGFPATRSHWP